MGYFRHGSGRQAGFDPAGRCGTVNNWRQKWAATEGADKRISAWASPMAPQILACVGKFVKYPGIIVGVVYKISAVLFVCEAIGLILIVSKSGTIHA